MKAKFSKAEDIHLTVEDRMLLAAVGVKDDIIYDARRLDSELRELEALLNNNPLTKLYAESQMGKGAFYTVTSLGEIELHKAGKRAKSKKETDEEVPKTGPDETQTHPDIETPPKGFFKTGDALTKPQVVSD